MRLLAVLVLLALCHHFSHAINGGEDAILGRHAYMVSLQRVTRLTNSCGGTLIAPDVVMTAAHCVDTQTTDTLVIRTQPYRVFDPVESSQLFSVLEITLHPNWDKPSRLQHDVALIKLNGTSTDQPIIRVNDNPRVPYDGQNLTTTGWGDRTDALRGYPNELQILENGPIYINNQVCSNLNGNLVKPDMLCVLEEEGEGICFGDSGGPAFIPGSLPEEDVQVGITSWIHTSCRTEITASVFARTSWHFRFIRNTLCSMSDSPPAYFNCPSEGGVVTTSPLPTVSPAPSIPEVPITVRLHLGSDFGSLGVSWRIETLHGVVLHEVNQLTYQSGNQFVVETIHVPLGEILNFVTVDASRGGLTLPSPEDAGAAFVFLGDQVDTNQVLAIVRPGFDNDLYTSFQASSDGVLPPLDFFSTGSSHPTASPSASLLPTSSNTVTVSVFIDFDTYPIHTSWQIAVNSTNRTVATGGPYSPFVGPNITESVILEEGETYRFTVFDTLRNGLSNGFGEVFVYLGTDPRTDQVLVYESGNFQSQSDSVFVAAAASTFVYTHSPSASPSTTDTPTHSMAPSKAPFVVTAAVFVDSAQYGTWFRLLDASGVMVLYDSGRLSINPPNVTVALEYGQTYIFVIYDFGGLKPGGYGIVTVGEELLTLEEAIKRDSVLGYLPGGEFSRYQLTTFTASPNGTIAMTVPPTPTPTTSVEPSVTKSNLPSEAPSTTTLPTATAQTDVTIEVEQSYEPRPISIMIQTADTMQTAYRTRGLPFSRQFWQTTISLDLGRKYLFTITDSDGDGLSRRLYRHVAVYLGSEVDVDKTLMLFEGNFGFVRKQYFTASEDGLLGITKSPTHSPTRFPSHTPSISQSPSFVPSVSRVPSVSLAPSNTLTPILVVIDWSSSPRATSWMIEKPDGTLVTEFRPPTSRGYACNTTSFPLLVEVDVSHTLTFLNLYGTGMKAARCDGRAFVYSSTEVDPDKVLVFEDGDFGFSSSHTFLIASTSAGPSMMAATPSVGPADEEAVSHPPFSRVGQKSSKSLLSWWRNP